MAKDIHDCLNISCKIISECHRFYKGSAPPCAKAVVENCHSLQQLKVEIAALAERIESSARVGDVVQPLEIFRELRQLSAV